MASSLFVHCILLVAPLVSGVAVDSQQRIVRREGDGAMELSSKGKLVSLMTRRRNGTNACDPSTESDFPRCDFPKGVDLTDTCKEGHSKIEQSALCEYAAQETAGARLPVANERHPFIITVAEIGRQRSRPRGCFAEPCSDASVSPAMCFYFNELAEDATEADYAVTVGTPVCARDYFVDGVATSADTTNGCPDGYVKIADQEYCLAKGNLLGYGTGSPFRTGSTEICKADPADPVEVACIETEHAKQMDHPIGCFIEDGLTYFNWDYENGAMNPTNANGLKGIPLCKVTDDFRGASWP